ncbi:MAG: type I restriction-modification system subunit M [Prevotella sp.]|nr:type I restriction-modification system subunit M [Prevotella sp.]
MAVGNLVKQLQDIMRKDAGINGDAQRIEQMVWVIFLKVYDAQEEDWELDDDKYKSIIPEPLRWRNWAHSKDDGGQKTASLTGDALLDFVNNKLFPVLKGNNIGEKGKEGYIEGIRVTRDTPRHKAIVYDVFSEVNQYMKDGGQLRQMIDKVDEIDLLDSEESHAFGNMYESILKDLQAAGNAGEFYTPRAVTDFIIQMLNPRLGEVVGDFAMGTGGFLVSALTYLRKQVTKGSDMVLWQQSVIGQEWKPFPYLLAVTNVLLHEIKNPQLFHMDSLGRSMSDYEEEGKVNVIAMNPPYGGATSSTTKMNFKAEYRSSETADLFMVLIMQRLAEEGRAGVIVPDGFLFGTDGPKLAIKKRLLKEFNLHTIIRLPGSVFSPYTSIATNILFFNNERADDAPEGFNTARTWFYRLDKPKGYINFSKTKPMLLQHFDPVVEWWNNREVLANGEKAQSFTPQEIEAGSYNLDLCKFPKEEEVILTPQELIFEYKKRRQELDVKIDRTLAKIEDMLGIKTKEL